MLVTWDLGVHRPGAVVVQEDQPFPREGDHRPPDKLNKSDISLITQKALVPANVPSSTR